MYKNILKGIFFTVSLMLSTTVNADTQDAVKVIDGKKYYVHKVEPKETVFGLTRNYKVTQSELTKLNPKISNGLMTGMEVLIPINPQNSKGYVAGTKTTSTENKPKTASAKTDNNTTIHKVEAGETLFSISRKYNVPVEEIKKQNAEALKNGLKSGTNLKITKNSTTATSNTASASSDKSGLTVHEIQKGETLFGISKEYNVDIKEVERLNPQIKKTGVKAGKSLIMPSTNRYIAKKHSSSDYKVHKVQKNETVFSISQKYRVSSTELIQRNNISNGLIEGQYIALPTKPNLVKKDDAVKRSKNVAHTVKKGETMFGLCKTYKVTETELIQINPELKNGLKEGRMIFIPRAEEKRASWACGQETQGNGHVNMAIILPFDSEDGKINKNADKFIEFYEGALLAADRLKKDSISIDLFVYNSGKTENEINAILKKPEFQNMDLIIGPAYKAQFGPISEFAKEKNVKVVVPFSTRTEEMKTNPNMFLVNAPRPQSAATTARRISTMFKDKNIIIVRFENEEYNDQAELCDTLATILRQKGKEFKDIKFSTTEKLQEQIKEGEETLLIPATTNQMALSDFLPSINAIALKEKIELFGYHDWTKYQSISKDLYIVNTYYASPFEIDFTRYTPKTFIKNFRNYFSQEPGNTQPMYGAMGYDILQYFGRAVAQFGRNFEHNIDYINVTPVQSNFYFEKYSNEGGYYNNFIEISANNKIDGHKVINE